MLRILMFLGLLFTRTLVFGAVGAAGSLLEEPTTHPGAVLVVVKAKSTHRGEGREGWVLVFLLDIANIQPRRWVCERHGRTQVSITWTGG